MTNLSDVAILSIYDNCDTCTKINIIKIKQWNYDTLKLFDFEKFKKALLLYDIYEGKYKYTYTRSVMANILLSLGTYMLEDTKYEAWRYSDLESLKILEPRYNHNDCKKFYNNHFDLWKLDPKDSLIMRYFRKLQREGR